MGWGKWREIDSAEGIKLADANYAGEKWIFAENLAPSPARPQALDSVVIPHPPIEIKVGDIVGHLDTYIRMGETGSNRELLHLELLAGPDLPDFIAKCRQADQNAPVADKTLLFIDKGRSSRRSRAPPASSPPPPT